MKESLCLLGIDWNHAMASGFFFGSRCMLSKRIVLTFPRQLLGGLNKATFRVIFEVGFMVFKNDKGRMMRLEIFRSYRLCSSVRRWLCRFVCFC